MSESLEVRGVVVGHGDMARGLVDAVRQIAGTQADALLAISNDGKAPAQLAQELDDAAGSGPVIVFTDLQSGSCGVAAAYTCRDRERRAIVCGVNLPMLLDFVFHRAVSLPELVERLVDKGREAIAATPVGAPRRASDSGR
jgi:mannose/fructose-specific phosphotransferase system component IIA